MYEKVEFCPSCNSKEFNNHIICDDHSVSQESFAIVKCNNCGLLVTSPRPDIASIGQYYESTDYISHTNKANNLINWVYKIARSYTLRRKFKLITRFASKKSILDYGCGTGHLLEYIQRKKGWKTVGVEPDEMARTLAISDHDLNVVGALADLPDKRFGVITLWHVLEHVHDLNDTIQTLRKLLSKKGRLIIAVPNPESLDQQIYKQHWAAYDVPRHLYHFTQSTIKELMKYNKFTLEEIRPMMLDAYYVSMLSEKHKFGKVNYLKSFINGCKSNTWASKNNKNYSSLIYIFKKA
ncbi:Methyltransferase domain-containing protein [Reichenbachiella faecimaris]|uniref:Methyltransferase domain-containing protein n=1 Tax=Reichenbachiella faecimaris TaxID=692418 RepID=A0A1W2GDR1_REIFA|nr:class I SAM-dependent methyltransferase [Reichenbachiella faecimaris]SMD34797.1 Methyltransferase domain-containing protein [Reichenbachiella faecimaris]